MPGEETIAERLRLRRQGEGANVDAAPENAAAQAAGEDAAPAVAEQPAMRPPPRADPAPGGDAPRARAASPLLGYRQVPVMTVAEQQPTVDGFAEKDQIAIDLTAEGKVYSVTAVVLSVRLLSDHVIATVQITLDEDSSQLRLPHPPKVQGISILMLENLGGTARLKAILSRGRMEGPDIHAPALWARYVFSDPQGLAAWQARLDENFKTALVPNRNVNGLPFCNERRELTRALQQWKALVSEYRETIDPLVEAFNAQAHPSERLRRPELTTLSTMAEDLATRGAVLGLKVEGATQATVDKFRADVLRLPRKQAFDEAMTAARSHQKAKKKDEKQP